MTSIVYNFTHGWAWTRGSSYFGQLAVMIIISLVLFGGMYLDMEITENEAALALAEQEQVQQ